MTKRGREELREEWSRFAAAQTDRQARTSLLMVSLLLHIEQNNPGPHIMIYEWNWRPPYTVFDFKPRLLPCKICHCRKPKLGISNAASKQATPDRISGGESEDLTICPSTSVLMGRSGYVPVLQRQDRFPA